MILQDKAAPGRISLSGARGSTDVYSEHACCVQVEQATGSGISLGALRICRDASVSVSVSVYSFHLPAP